MIRACAFDNAFTFIYSKRSHTKAALMEEALSEEEVRARNQNAFDRVLCEVQASARRQSAKYLGQTQEVLVEGINAQDPSLLTGRMSNNLLVHFPGNPEDIGTFVHAHLDDCRGFYYLGHKI